MSDSETTPEVSSPEPPPPDELVTRILALNLQAAAYDGKANCPAVEVPVVRLVELMEKLRHDPEFEFDMLISHTVVDRIEKNLFELVYFLYSLNHQKKLMVSVLIPRDKPVAPTLCRIWRIAEWQEREAYDLFGILYDNHPDLRRVFLEDDWQGFPLRKDYQDDFMLTWELEEK